MRLIERPLYIERLKRVKGTPDIKIITGIRRCGKSRLLQAFIKHIKETEESANIIFIDFTRLEFEPVREYHALHQYVQDHYRANVYSHLHSLLIG